MAESEHKEMEKEEQDKWVAFFQEAHTRGVSEDEVAWALRMIQFRVPYQECMDALAKGRELRGESLEGLLP